MCKVKLISYTPNSEKVVAMAAKLCYSKCNISEIEENLSDLDVQTFIKMLVKLGHESPFEHISFTFGIENISRACMAQITRHRIASYSVKSQRYVQESEFNYIIPPEIEKIPQAREVFLESIISSQSCYNKIVDILKVNYKITIGLDKNSHEKKSIEDARFVLPNACETKMICTFNARSLFNFFKHRCCSRAQWEIRELATKMLKLVRKIAPNIFENCGPSCVNGVCKEGKMTCGKNIEIREIFKNLC
ncbi:MAG: FAD-dependent thymidylate synthase [Candidatus Paraimprobicoccus trichonymphae]|uniref:Flavin-dependent thymidylate synthase n=1 Tax=Candidatus Paraimprobicoccus trichonymphae TaxID=3033793 RepID=A0AA48IC67_9FIRM|nr:MAG: FAD-dependent thymidylate synthase [Candidatus Paraimprobicoccus trichonymphae]